MSKERLELVPDLEWTNPAIDEYWFEIKASNPERLKAIFDWLSERYGATRAYGPERTFGYYLHRMLREELRWDQDDELVYIDNDQGIMGYALGIMLDKQQAVELKLVFDELFNA